MCYKDLFSEVSSSTPKYTHTTNDKTLSDLKFSVLLPGQWLDRSTQIGTDVIGIHFLCYSLEAEGLFPLVRIFFNLLPCAGYFFNASD